MNELIVEQAFNAAQFMKEEKGYLRRRWVIKGLYTRSKPQGCHDVADDRIVVKSPNRSWWEVKNPVCVSIHGESPSSYRLSYRLSSCASLQSEHYGVLDDSLSHFEIACFA